MMKKKPDFSEVIEVIKDKNIIFMMILVIVFMLLNTGLSLLLPTISAKVIDRYFIEGFLDNKLVYAILGITLFTLVMSYVQYYFTYMVGERFSFISRNRLYKKVIDQPEKYFIKRDKSKILTIFMSDINFIKEIFSDLVRLALTGILMIIGSSILMLRLDVKLALIIIVLVPALFMLIMTVMKKLRELFMKIQHERDNFNRIIDENVKASMLVRVFTSEKEEMEKFEKTNLGNLNLQKKIISKISVVIPGINFINFLCTMLIVYFGGMGFIGGTMTLGDISAFNSYVVMFIMPIMMIGMISNFVGQALASIDRINSILGDRNEFIDGKEDITQIDSFETKDISLNINDKSILDGIDFKISRGEKIGIIGLTGSGKSMLMQLLLRLIEPDSGKIILNNRNLCDYKVDMVRDRIGMVFQDNFLLDDTIDTNIDFKRGLSKDMISKARDIADVDEFYLGKSSAYKIGEFGKKLSGGQKQRLRIARAVAADPDLLIFDDCTSNLDIKTEQRILKNIRKMNKDIAIIMISQKIASLSDCDRIYVMDNGKVTGVGTHEYLIENSLVYKEIEMTQKNRGN